MRSAVESAVYWGEDPISGMNDSLAIFRRLGAVYLTHKSKLYIATPGNWLVSRLTSMDPRGIDVTLFEDCIKIVDYYGTGQPLWYAWEKASCDLHHPLGPRPDTALAFLLHVDACYEAFFKTGDDFLDTKIHMKMREAAHALHAAGRSTEAKKVLDIGRRRLPRFFHGKQVTMERRNVEAVQSMWAQRTLERTSERAKLIFEEFERNSLQNFSLERGARKGNSDWSRG